jgi:hypothetical protein
MHKYMVAIEVSRQGVTSKLVDFDCMIIMPIKVKTWIARS